MISRRNICNLDRTGVYIYSDRDNAVFSASSDVTGVDEARRGTRRQMFRRVGEREEGWSLLLAGVAMLNNRVAGTFSRNEDVYQDPATGNWFTNRPRERQLLHPTLFVSSPFPPTPSPLAHPRLLAQTFRHPCSFSILLSSTHRFSLVLSLVAETNPFEFSVHRRKTFSISSLVAKIHEERKVFHRQLTPVPFVKWNPENAF